MRQSVTIIRTHSLPASDIFPRGRMGFIVTATDDISGHNAFTMPLDGLGPGEFFATIRGLALLQMDHVILNKEIVSQ